MESCPVNARDKQSLEFTVNRVLMKLFRTGSVSVIEECQKHFNFLAIKHLIDAKTAKFLQNFCATENYICHLFLSKLLGKSATSQTATASQIRAEINRKFFTSLAK